MELSATSGGADEAGIAAELGVTNARLRSRYGKGKLANVPANPLEEAFARGNHASPKHDHVGIHRVHDVDGAHRKIKGCIFD